LAVAALGVVLLVAGVVVWRSGTSVAGGAVPLGTPSPPATTASTVVADGPVVVHVVGAVVTPGVVTLPGGSRVGDAIDAVGGSTPEADLSAVNLARPLVDGEQVWVPRPGEAPVPDASVDDGLVNINTADAATLDTLPGVGPVLAGRIIAARPFTSVDDLERVSGIGPAVLANLRPLVKV
jgi:competence protein ComEA